MILDGQELMKYDAVGDPIFSPDSQRIAYIATKANMQLRVVDNQAQPQYDAVRDPISSPDSCHTGPNYDSLVKTRFEEVPAL